MSLNNEDRILAMLEKLDARQSRAETVLEKMDARLSNLEKDVSDIKFDLRETLSDVDKNEARLRQHEKEYHSIGIKE